MKASHASLLFLPLLGLAAVAAACTTKDSGVTADADAGVPGTDAATATDGPAPEEDAGPTDPCDEDVGPGGMWIHLGCTGMYTDVKAKTLSPKIRAFAPGQPFWSDGAAKERYIFLPEGQKIDTADMDNWKFPIGTRTYKEFKLGGKRIETRVYVKASAFLWRKTTYRWNADESDAIRLDTGEQNINGTKIEIPDTGRCDNCHGGVGDRVLGFDAISLGMPGATGLTLDVLAKEDRLTVKPAKTKFTIPDDATGKAPAALAWLHANCSSCHSTLPEATARFVQLDLRLYAAEMLGAGAPPAVSALELYKSTVDKPMNVITRGPTKRITSGNADESGVVFLAGLRSDDGTGQMPPATSHLVDTEGLAKVKDWINASP